MTQLIGWRLIKLESYFIDEGTIYKVDVLGTF